jgi:hypothetical protein
MAYRSIIFLPKYKKIHNGNLVATLNREKSLMLVGHSDE